jgi:uncharacterized protein (DUF2249 family)
MKMENDKIPSMLLNTLSIDFCHPSDWVSTFKAHLCLKINKKKIKKNREGNQKE